MKHLALAVGVALAVSTAAVASPAVASSRAATTPGAVYFGYKGAGVEVTTHQGGWSKLSAGGGGFVAQFAAAPDGTKIAWIDGKSRLHVKSASGDKVIAKNAAYGSPCLTPAWTADGKRIAYVVKGTATAATVNVVGAKGGVPVTAGRTLGVCHLAWSADGRTLAGYAGDARGVHLLDTRTHASRKVPGIKLVNHVDGLSPDGSRVLVNAISANDPGGDGSWPLAFTPSLYDTRTGRKVAIPVRGTLIGARYLYDGTLVVRVRGAKENTWVVLDPDTFKVSQRVPEPAQARNLGLLNVLG
ncbi:hypothetical protein [Streptosporangium carneum]|uniref:WD40 repeat domain-containing protein n=1 Tax=Streptosporangium carneum TaxID=47481 RepID=A0A9W6MDS5_9ACTN|nr:hypothetical protein [Streptosporangium carneum]GLK10225.1 hypothetical protein GCM10017600_36310 [Streptosporangium carneum]